MSAHERDPRDAEMAERAAAIAARAHKRFAEWDRRRQPVHEDPAFIRAANRMCDLRPVRIGLTIALRQGRKAYTTVLNGTPVAFMTSGWYTQEMADEKIAAQEKKA